MIGKNERTVRQRKNVFFSNKGNFPDSLQGKYQGQGILWTHEELNEATTDYVRSNAVVKGKPNMTAISFCRWVNESLIVSLFSL